MVDTIIPPKYPEPLGPIRSREDIRVALRKLNDHNALLTRLIVNEILPSLRKREEETDTKAASSHTHDASDIDSGTMATARLGSGTADNTTFLRGDQTYAVPSADPDINGATATTDVPVPGSDKLLVYDASATANRSILISHLRRIAVADIAATGTTQGAAALLTANYNKITSGDASNDGVIPPDVGTGQLLFVENQSGITVNVYPTTSGAINGGTTNAAETLLDSTWCILIRNGSTDWRKVDI